MTALLEVARVRHGDRGDDVRRVQRLVGATPDGIAGPLTMAAIRRWLQRNGSAPFSTRSGGDRITDSMIAAHALKAWRPDPDDAGTYIDPGDLPATRLVGRRVGAKKRRRAARLSVMHCTDGWACNGIESLEHYQLREQTGYGGYSGAGALDLDTPRLLMHPDRFRANHTWGWNDEADGFALVFRLSEWPDLDVAEQMHLAGLAVMWLRWRGNLSCAKHGGVWLGDRNRLFAPRRGRPEMPDGWAPGPGPGWVAAHDWLVGDRNRNGRLDRHDDQRADPGEDAFRLLLRMRRCPVLS